MIPVWTMSLDTDPSLTVEQQIELVKRDQESLEKRVALIEALIDSVRTKDIETVDGES